MHQLHVPERKKIINVKPQLLLLNMGRNKMALNTFIIIKPRNLLKLHLQ
jgi:hypothetical protein